jgi:mannitol/fructose-specific phosphotransferase system IIA component (Ntr-type)
MAAVLADVLDEQNVTLELRAATRDDAVREIVATMAGAAKVRLPHKFVEEVLAREKSHTTLVGRGVALPHSRSELVEGIVLGIGRSAAGVPWGGQGEPAHLIFVIAVPRRMVTSYLVCVGALARITKSEANRAALLKAASAAELIELLRTESLLLE